MAITMTSSQKSKTKRVTEMLLQQQVPTEADSQVMRIGQCVRNNLSLMISQRLKENGRKVEKLAIELQKKHSPVEICSAYGADLQSVLPAACKTIYDAFSDTMAPTLMMIAIAYGEQTALAWIKAQLLVVNDFVGARMKLTDEQLKGLGIQILVEFHYLNTLEFILFCGRLRSGRYEDFYSSVDPMRILKSLSTFSYERMRDIRAAREALEKEKLEVERMEHDKEVITYEEFIRIYNKKLQK